MKKNIFLVVALLLLGCAGSMIKYPEALDRISEEELIQGANAVVVFDSTEIRVARDGTSSATKHELVKVLTSLGRKQFGEATFSYIAIYDTVVVEGAWVIKPDKKVVKVPKTAITDMPMPAWEGSKFYIPNLRFVKIAFPELEDGGALMYRVKTITHNAPFDSTFDYWELFEGTEPIKNKVLKIMVPVDMKLRYTVENGTVEHTETTSGKNMLHTWTRTNVPRVVSEPSMPPFENIVTKLLVTCTDSWKDYSRWYYQISEPNLVPDTAITNTVAEVTATAKTRNDTIKMLYEYVCKEIRYVETELIGKKGGYEPAPAIFTFKNKYGVCRDKAALLVSLLRTAGVKESYMVLTNPGILEMKPDMPVSSQFNHAIVAIKTDTGFCYLDPTAEHSAEYLVAYEHDKPVLVCTESGEGIAKTPPPVAADNLTEILSETELDKDGTLRGFTRITATGINDYGLRYMFQMLPGEQLEQYFLNTLKTLSSKTTLDSMKHTDPQDFAIPMQVTLYFTAPDFVLKIGKEWHISSSSARAGQQPGSMWSLSERKYPLYMWVISTSHSVSSMKYPGNLSVKSLPEDQTINDAFIMYLRKMSKTEKKNMIVSENEFSFKKNLVPSDQYPGVKENMQKIEEFESQEIVLEEK